MLFFSLSLLVQVPIHFVFLEVHSTEMPRYAELLADICLEIILLEQNTILSLSNFVIFSIFMLSCPQCADIALVHPLNDSPGFHSFSLKTTRKRKRSGSSEANDFCFNLCSPVFLLISHSPHRCDQVCRLQQS